MTWSMPMHAISSDAWQTVQWHRGRVVEQCECISRSRTSTHSTALSRCPLRSVDACSAFHSAEDKQ